MGQKLFGEVTDATGLPKELVSEELGRLAQKAGVDPDTMTLDDLREILAEYVQDILLSAREESDRNAPSARAPKAKTHRKP